MGEHPTSSPGQRAGRRQRDLSSSSGHPSNVAIMKPTSNQSHSHRDPPADNGPAVEDHGRVLTTNRRAAAFYRRAQRAVDGRQVTNALRLAVNADPTFALAIADLDAITGTAGEGPGRQQMSWERNH